MKDLESRLRNADQQTAGTGALLAEAAMEIRALKQQLGAAIVLAERYKQALLTARDDLNKTIHNSLEEVT